MFDKKCRVCNNKMKKNYEFCPFCGNSFKSTYDKEDYGIIGKNDILDEQIFPGFGPSMFDKILNQTMKMLDKQMKTMAQQMDQPYKKIPLNEINPNLNVQFFVNGRKVFPQVSEIREEIQKQPQRVKANKMPEEKLVKFAKLRRIEPNTRMRRLGQRLIYELEIPGVKNLDDILINRLENSIEIKALAKDKSYSKIINVNLPILRYVLNNGNLILELQA